MFGQRQSLVQTLPGLVPLLHVEVTHPQVVEDLPVGTLAPVLRLLVRLDSWIEQIRLVLISDRQNTDQVCVFREGTETSPFVWCCPHCWGWECCKLETVPEIPESFLLVSISILNMSCVPSENIISLFKIRVFRKTFYLGHSSRIHTLNEIPATVSWWWLCISVKLYQAQNK